MFYKVGESLQEIVIFDIKFFLCYKFSCKKLEKVIEIFNKLGDLIS